MLIVQGVFRSGTSALFRALREDPNRTCYYEPLHPNLLDHVTDAQSNRSEHSKSSLYTQYISLLPRLQTIYRPSFWKRCATLEENDDAPLFRKYLQLLDRSANQVVLQLNRAFWMTPWLSRIFPQARFVHLVRSPCSVVWSQLTTQSGERVRMDWPILGRLFSFSSGDLSNVFSRYAYHGAYQVRDYFRLALDRFSNRTQGVRHWAHSCLKDVQDHRPYVQALAVWGAQTRVCHHEGREAFGDQYFCLRYRDLCTSPRRALRKIYALHDAPPPAATTQYAHSQFRSNRVASWKRGLEIQTRFQEGLQRAGLTPALEEFGYDALLD